MRRLLPLLILFISINVFAQNRGPRHEKIKVLKIAFITEKLSLTEDEAQKFWPIYNAIDKNITNIKFHEMRDLRYELKRDMGSLTEKQANDLLIRFMEAENKLHYERTQLVEKLRGVISAKKIIILKSAEDEFNRKMLEQFRKRRDNFKKNKP